MKRITILIATTFFVVVLLLVAAGCTQQAGTSGSTPAATTTSTTAGNTVGILYTAGVGPMPQLLATQQIDGYIAWQPYVSIATKSGIGKLVVYSGQLPPDNSNVNHPCCILFARDDLIAENPDLVTAISALTQESSAYINAHPSEAADLEADFLVGKSNFTFGNVSVSSVDVLNDAFPTVRYTNDPSPQWVNDTKRFVNTEIQLGYVNNQLKNASADQLDSLLFDFGPYQNAKQELAAGKINTPHMEANPITIGYLTGDMHSAALSIALKKYQYFNDTYGVALVPRDPTQTRPDTADLVVNGVKVAEVKLVSGSAGPQVMQMAATNVVQIGYVGVPPTIAAIDKGTPVKVINPINTEGSGLVVTPGAPVTDWNSFVAWAQQRAAEGKPLKIAAPGKGSIQDVLLQFALKSSNVSFATVSS
jgi:NitT/TauT family transport system substrate-binding protein